MSFLLRPAAGLNLRFVALPAVPIPIGLSLVRSLRREDGRLIVMGLDCFDGTPVLDIKPYRDDYRTDKHELCWMTPQATRQGRGRNLENFF